MRRQRVLALLQEFAHEWRVILEQGAQPGRIDPEARKGVLRCREFEPFWDALVPALSL